MKVVDGQFGKKKEEEPDLVPMGAALLEVVMDPFIAEVSKGTFLLMIQSEEVGTVCLSSTADVSEMNLMIDVLKSTLLRAHAEGEL